MLCKETVGVRKKHGLQTRQARSWSKRCSVHVHDRQPPIKASDMKDHFKPAICYRLGMCVCGHSEGSTPDVLSFWNNMEPWLRATLSKAKKGDYSKARKMMQDQLLVFSFTSSPAWDANTERPSEPAEDVEEVVHYVYPAYTNFQSFHFTCLRLYAELQTVLGHSTEGIPDIPGVLHVGCKNSQQVDSNHEVFNDLEFVREALDLSRAWQIKLLGISLSESHWPYDSQASNVLPLIDATETCEASAVWIWRGSEYEAHSRQRKATNRKRSGSAAGIGRGRGRGAAGASKRARGRGHAGHAADGAPGAQPAPNPDPNLANDVAEEAQAEAPHPYEVPDVSILADLSEDEGGGVGDIDPGDMVGLALSQSECSDVPSLDAERADNEAASEVGDDEGKKDFLHEIQALEAAEAATAAVLSSSLPGARAVGARDVEAQVDDLYQEIFAEANLPPAGVEAAVEPVEPASGSRPARHESRVRASQREFNSESVRVSSDSELCATEPWML